MPAPPVPRRARRPFPRAVRSFMSKLVQILFLLVLIVLVGGVAFLATWDMPAPTEPVQRVIPNDRFG